MRDPPPDLLQTTIQHVTEVFDQVDAATAAFAQASGLRCPEGCGKCCDNPFQIAATPAELAPVAQFLIQTGQAETFLARTEQDTSGACVFYEPHPNSQGKGRCGMYQHRPLVCRLFGFAATRDKHARPRLATCAIHRQTQPDLVAIAEANVASGRLTAPIFSDALSSVAALSPYPLEINDALGVALQRALWRASLSDSDEDG